MLTDIECPGVLHGENGLVVATGVILLMALGEENRPYGLGDIKGTLTIHDAPTFVQRNVDKQFLFVPDVDSESDFTVHIANENGVCVVVPTSKHDSV